MISMCILNAPEFSGVVDAARRSGMAVEEQGDYLRVSIDSEEVTLTPLSAEIPAAIWFGALTGGFDGILIKLDRKWSWGRGIRWQPENAVLE